MENKIERNIQLKSVILKLKEFVQLNSLGYSLTHYMLIILTKNVYPQLYNLLCVGVVVNI